MSNLIENGPGCLLITGDADEFATEIAHLSDNEIPVTACHSAAEARRDYRGETILFGRPDTIAEVLSDFRAVRWVQSSWAGVTPLLAASRRDYLLTGIKDVLNPQMAEYALGHILEYELRIGERRRHQAKQEWYTKGSGTLVGKTLGIMGTGSIGSHVARTASAFGLTATGLSRSGRARSDFKQVFGVHQLHTFLSGLDYLVCALPDTPETDHLLDARALAALPPHAFLVNVGRGNVIDNGALIAALSSNRLGGASLDVFTEEPLPGNDPLWHTPKVTVTAHVAAISHPSLIAPIFVDNYRRYTTGQPLNFVIDFSRGY